MEKPVHHIIYFEIESKNPEREIHFYSTIFGWKFVKEKNLPIEYYRIKAGNIEGGLLKRQQDTPLLGQGLNAAVNSILVENFDTTAELILTSGGKVIIPKFVVPGRGWQGYFTDPDNNAFGIFERMKDVNTDQL